MEYRRNYLQALKTMRANRERDGKPVSAKRSSGLAARAREQVGDMGEFNPVDYMEEIDSFLVGLESAPDTSLRPKARPEKETESLGLEDGVSLRPQSRGDALGNEAGKRLMEDLQEEFGLTQEQAAAFVGNLAQETGDFEFMQEIKPKIEGSKGGWGFAQWTGGRRKRFEDWIEETGLDPKSYEANWGYLKKELTEEDPEIKRMGIETIKNLKEMDDLEEATRYVSDYFLRPGEPHMEKRLRYANAYMEF